jgi:hypothetical protein
VEALRKQISLLTSENETRMQQLAEQKDAEIQAAQSKIEELSRMPAQKQQSFWKKWFLPREN